MLHYVVENAQTPLSVGPWSLESLEEQKKFFLNSIWKSTSTYIVNFIKSTQPIGIDWEIDRR